jgi:hypothetical protein
LTATAARPCGVTSFQGAIFPKLKIKTARPKSLSFLFRREQLANNRFGLDGSRGLRSDRLQAINERVVGLYRLFNRSTRSKSALGPVGDSMEDFK